MIQLNSPRKSSTNYRSPSKLAVNKDAIFEFLFSVRGVITVLVILNIITLYFVLNPLFLRQTSENQKILNEVEKLTDINTFETPVFSRIKDVETIKASSGINAEVYQNAQNGDYVLGFSDKMVIYRRDEKSIVYEGDSPGMILQRQQQEVIATIIDKAKKLNLVEANYSSTPQLSVVTDEELVKQTNPDFYANTKNGDIIAFFTDKNVILVYNPDSDTVVNFGRFTTQIQDY